MDVPVISPGCDGPSVGMAGNEGLAGLELPDSPIQRFGARNEPGQEERADVIRTSLNAAAVGKFS